MVLVGATLLVFPALMVFAAFSDLFTMTISNRISIVLVLVFVLLALALHVPLDEIGQHLLCGLCVLALTFLFFAFRWIGGGDAKLAAATALWLGFDHLLDYGLYAALLGGALTVSILMMRRWPLPRILITQDWIARLHDDNNGVPYGIALAVAGLMLYPETRIWLSAIAF
ncbi:MAG: peptidase [Beijerinckiaceae bacterium]|nr:MAG: peptidase [Beijerinckiaceae bacterium]